MDEPAVPPSPPTAGISAEARRWLHETYRALDHDEAELANYRTTFIAAVTTALVAALVYAVANILPRGDLLFAATASFLATIGIILSAIWALVLWRTTAAQNLWRTAARELERVVPPVELIVPVSIPVRPGREITVDLSRPYLAHQKRFSRSPEIPWLDQLSPSRLSNLLPVLLTATWVIVLAAVWTLVLLRGP